MNPQRRHPAVPCRPRCRRHQGLPNASKRLEGMRILLAEDGPDHVGHIAFHLERAGALVTSVANGRKALELLTVDGIARGSLRALSGFDLIRTDMAMSERDGYELARRLRVGAYRGPGVGAA